MTQPPARGDALRYLCPGHSHVLHVLQDALRGERKTRCRGERLNRKRAKEGARTASHTVDKATVSPKLLEGNRLNLFLGKYSAMHCYLGLPP